MTDVHSKKIRSKNMAAIRGRGNKSTELKIVRLFREKKITGWRRHVKKIPGKPDFIFPKQKIAVFVDGCFWHGCPKCYKKPKTNKKFWKEKIEGNIKRDKKNRAKLRREGWKVLRIWEHDINKNFKISIEKIISFLDK